MSAISASEKPHMQQVDLNTLNLQQLTQLKNQLDQVCGIGRGRSEMERSINWRYFCCVSGADRFSRITANSENGSREILRLEGSTGTVQTRLERETDFGATDGVREDGSYTFV